MYPAMENLDLVLQETGDSQSLTNSRLVECDSSQAIQTRLDHPDRVVPPSRDLPLDIFPVAPASSRSICNHVEIASICVTSTRSRPMYIPTSSQFGQRCFKLQDYPCRRIILIVPGWPSMPWFCDLVAM